MPQEIERKFLVKNNDFKAFSIREIGVVQAYLSSVPERIVRVRIWGDKAFITVKGIQKEHSISRYEWEKEIPYADALDLLKLCEPGRIEKIRYIVPFEGHKFEVDEFKGDNQGLVTAEVELESTEEKFSYPPWLGDEVTGMRKYYNSQLSKNPFTIW